MKSTNRFSLLLKDTSNNIKTPNAKTANNTKIEILPNKTNRFISKHVTEERNKKQKEGNFIKSLDSLIEFPELQIKKKECITLTNTKSSNFIDAIKMSNLVINEEITNENPGEDNIPPGCLCIKFDKITNKQVWLYGDKTSNNEVTKNEEKPYFIFQRVVELCNNRKNEHIKNWGIEEYDQMFKFQNYDYEYFDKLDEQNN